MKHTIAQKVQDAVDAYRASHYYFDPHNIVIHQRDWNTLVDELDMPDKRKFKFADNANYMGYRIIRTTDVKEGEPFAC
jgi:hypothetical protein